MKTDVRKYCIQTIENKSVLTPGENTVLSKATQTL